MVGKYIDALSDEQRDRIIEAEDFFTGPCYFSVDGCGCLVGVAEMRDEMGARPIDDSIRGRLHGGITMRPSWYFPVLCDRFGKDRIVALCKARAAKGNKIQVVREIRDGIFQERKDAAERDRFLVPVGGMNGKHPRDTR